jgi:hypothetical protein
MLFFGGKTVDKVLLKEVAELRKIIVMVMLGLLLPFFTCCAWLKKIASKY